MLQIRWHGHSCFEITNDVTIVTDPHDGKSIGIPTPNVVGDIIFVSHNHYDHNSVKTVEKENSKVITDERKRTIGNIQISGIPAFHDAAQGERRGNMILYKFICDDITFCHLGDLGHELDEKTVQQIGNIDILFIPVGGNYTIDAEQAWRVIQTLKPKIIIPMHYRIEGLSIPIAGVEPFLEKNIYKIIKVGNEIDIEKDDLPKQPEVWVFTL
jgi:L-ascorbate metabolism protein UlaG (beta-lactamase superfamily)